MKTSLPTREALLARVADIFSLLDETAEKSEALRTLCSEAVNALHEAELFGLWVPSECGSEAFVPERLVLTKTPRSGWRKSDPGPRLPIEHALVSLGGARRALDEVTEQAASKYRLLESQSVASKQSFQTELGRLEAEWESLYAGVRRLAKEMTRISQVDPAGLMPGAAKLRAVCAHATERSLAIGGRALRQAGAGAVASRNVLQRIHRDLTVSAQHAMIADDSYEDFGKRLLGRDTSGKTTKGA